jgi:GGDEF domain-containing protein
VNDFMGPSSGVLHEMPFRHFLRRETQRAARYQGFLAVCLLRPDGVDMPGREAEAIQLAVSRKIAQFVRSTDLVGRVPTGIAVLLPHTAGSEAMRTVERICVQIGQASFPAARHGAAAHHPERGQRVVPNDGYTDSTLLSSAHSRLREAARRGGNQVVYAL